MWDRRPGTGLECSRDAGFSARGLLRSTPHWKVGRCLPSRVARSYSAQPRHPEVSSQNSSFQSEAGGFLYLRLWGEGEQWKLNAQ